MPTEFIALGLRHAFAALDASMQIWERNGLPENTSSNDASSPAYYVQTVFRPQRVYNLADKTELCHRLYILFKISDKHPEIQNVILDILAAVTTSKPSTPAIKEILSKGLNARIAAEASIDSAMQAYKKLKDIKTPEEGVDEVKKQLQAAEGKVFAVVMHHNHPVLSEIVSIAWRDAQIKKLSAAQENLKRFTPEGMLQAALEAIQSADKAQELASTTPIESHIEDADKKLIAAFEAIQLAEYYRPWTTQDYTQAKTPYNELTKYKQRPLIDRRAALAELKTLSKAEIASIDTKMILVRDFLQAAEKENLAALDGLGLQLSKLEETIGVFARKYMLTGDWLSSKKEQITAFKQQIENARLLKVNLLFKDATTAYEEAKDSDNLDKIRGALIILRDSKQAAKSIKNMTMWLDLKVKLNKLELSEAKLQADLLIDSAYVAYETVKNSDDLEKVTAVQERIYVAIESVKSVKRIDPSAKGIDAIVEPLTEKYKALSKAVSELKAKKWLIAEDEKKMNKLIVLANTAYEEVQNDPTVENRAQELLSAAIQAAKELSNHVVGLTDIVDPLIKKLIELVNTTYEKAQRDPSVENKNKARESLSGAIQSVQSVGEITGSTVGLTETMDLLVHKFKEMGSVKKKKMRKTKDTPDTPKVRVSSIIEIPNVSYASINDVTQAINDVTKKIASWTATIELGHTIDEKPQASDLSIDKKNLSSLVAQKENFIRQLDLLNIQRHLLRYKERLDKKDADLTSRPVETVNILNTSARVEKYRVITELLDTVGKGLAGYPDKKIEALGKVDKIINESAEKLRAQDPEDHKGFVGFFRWLKSVFADSHSEKMVLKPVVEVTNKYRAIIDKKRNEGDPPASASQPDLL
ncbi:MAG: hypothetical protein Q8R79_01525 [Legionellaceae bacterium]|nr:hypothetical protein [Legionellaceae bacterium]